MTNSLFPSWPTMIATDAILIALAFGGTMIVAVQWRHLKLGGAFSGIIFVLVGLWVGASLYIVDLYAMIIMPRWVGMSNAMDAMHALHLSYSWYINAASAMLVFIGLMITVVQLVRQLREIEGHTHQHRENESLLNSIFENVPVGLLIKDRNHVVERSNRTYVAWYGSDAQKMVGNRSEQVEDFQHSDDAQAMNAQEDEVFETGKTLHRQIERPFVDGQIHTVVITKFPIFDQKGEITRVGSVSVDLTERVRAEEDANSALLLAETANRAKTDFLANMSHELRTPLNSVLGFSALMNQEIFGPLGHKKYKEYAADIHDTGNHLLSVISDILDVSRIEANELEIFEERLNITELIEDCVRIVQYRADNADVILTTQIDRAFPYFLGDVVRIKQIVINLLTNAIKFTPPEGHVEAKAFIQEGATVLQVSDTGIGIAEEDMPRVLAPFQQVHTNHAHAAEGTGLGVHLSKRLAEMHGGSLSIESEVGTGTTVSIRFPAERTKTS